MNVDRIETFPFHYMTLAAALIHVNQHIVIALLYGQVRVMGCQLANPLFRTNPDRTGEGFALD